jgi:hypothetical protein
MGRAYMPFGLWILFSPILLFYYGVILMIWMTKLLIIGSVVVVGATVLLTAKLIQGVQQRR